MKYIATREGVEVLTGKGPTTEKQKELIAKLLKDFPDMRDSFEYEDYKQAPTLHTASALISAALDTHMQELQTENGYLKYIATRPGAEKHGAHGLFGREDNADLNAAMRDLTAHDGNVWTIIYSLHREDAERLGYNNAAAWRKLLVGQQNKFAEAFHVPSESLHWYAAYHDADTHPHIHMMIWTDQETVLKRDAAVVLHVHAVQRQNCAHRVKYCVVGAVGGAPIAFPGEQHLRVQQALFRVIEPRFRDLDFLFRKHSGYPPSEHFGRTEGSPHSEGTAPAERSE